MSAAKGYGAGFYGSNGFNAKTLQTWQTYMTDRNWRRRGDMVDDYNATDTQIETMKLFNTYIARFKWEGLPCPSYYLEQCLLFNGVAFAVKDDMLGNIVLPCTFTAFNVYNEPTQLAAHGFNFNKTYDVADGLLIYDNPMFFPPYIHLERAAQILGDLHRTCEVYSWGLKSPMLLHATADTAKSIKMMTESILRNEPYKVLELTNDGKKGAGVDTGEIKQFNSPNKALELRGIFQHKLAYFNDVIGTYGIGGVAGANKMAQTGEAEVAAGNFNVDSVLHAALEVRETFAERMSELFGNPVKVFNMVKNAADEAKQEQDSKDEVKPDALRQQK